VDIYKINSPANLQSRIDSIIAAKPNTGDTTYIIIGTPLVGAADNSSAWWTAFSDYFAAPANKLLHLEFINHSSGLNNWNNWNLVVTNEVADRSSKTYKEYFALRSDAYGWGNSDFNLKMVTQDYPDTNANGDIWDDFRTTMQGAHVYMDIDHSATGNVFVTVTMVGTNGTTLKETYQQPVSASANINAFLVCDGSHLDMKKAYLIPSKVTTITDVNPVSIAVTGAPAFVELGNKDFWGKAVATVTFADGSTKLADTADVSFNVVPDMTTVGKKNVMVAYSKTKKGVYGKAVSTFYTLEVTNPVKSLSVTTLPTLTTYYYFGTDSVLFDKTGIVVTGTYSDGSTGIIPNSSLKFSKIPAGAGSQSAVISFVGATKTITTTCPVTLVAGSSQVGVNNLTTAWWTAFSNDVTVPSGTSKTITLYCYSDNLQGWHSPCTILRKTSALPASNEFGVVRMDNFGWGSGYDNNANLVKTSDWDWTKFASNINGSKVVITVTNKGNNTADVLYNVTYANGETHFQKYAGVIVDSNDLSFALVTEESYLVLVN
jgi:hypothetical protein